MNLIQDKYEKNYIWPHHTDIAKNQKNTKYNIMTPLNSAMKMNKNPELYLHLEATSSQ